jgi:hypothetical protein
LLEIIRPSTPEVESLTDRLLEQEEFPMRRKYTIVAVVVGLLMSASPLATLRSDEPGQSQSAVKADRWAAWRSLVGTWEGSSEGRPGKGTVRLEVGFVLNERFLRLAGVADYVDAKDAREHHEDFGFVSYDRGRSSFVFRQFHSEGFVNQYTLTSDPSAQGKFELTSVYCENTPPGWRARETYVVSGDRLEHTFELAPPDKPFEHYTTATLKRRRN